MPTTCHGAAWLWWRPTPPTAVCCCRMLPASTPTAGTDCAGTNLTRTHRTLRPSGADPVSPASAEPRLTSASSFLADRQWSQKIVSVRNG
eukprot:3941299-Rhodomonas_salina.1